MIAQDRPTHSRIFFVFVIMGISWRKMWEIEGMIEMRKAILNRMRLTR